MRALLIASCALAAGCGRLGFDDVSQGDDSGAPCPATYTSLGDSCYRFFTLPEKTWIDAENDCEASQLGAHLAIVDDADEAALLAGFVTGDSDWIGLTDLVEEGSYLLVTGETPTFLDWGPGYPGGDGLDCVQLSNAGLLEDKTCDDLDEYICELDGRMVDPSSYQ